jgi:FixJ family two-component response regulator
MKSEPIPVGPRREQTGRGATSKSNLIFVVDDDHGFLKAITRLLKAHGFYVRTFLSAEEFLGRGYMEEPCCLILDVNLGGISGIDLLRELSRSGSTTPVIVITANDSPSRRKAAFAAGCAAYLEKPFTLESLSDALSGLGQ